MDHNLIEEYCAAIGLDYNTAESHGLLCGLLCAQPELLYTDWLHQLNEEAGETANQNTRDQYQQALENFFSSTLTHLGSADFSFQPLLPNDDAPLSERTQALTDWCQGFLYGVGSSQLNKRDNLPNDINEILNDLTEISRAIYNDTGTNEEDEVAYFELIEYIRGAVMLIYAESQHALIQPTDDKPTVH